MTKHLRIANVDIQTGICPGCGTEKRLPVEFDYLDLHLRTCGSACWNKTFADVFGTLEDAIGELPPPANDMADAACDQCGREYSNTPFAVGDKKVCGLGCYSKAANELKQAETEAELFDDRVHAIARRVADAFNVAGPAPAIRDAAKRKLEREWRTLYNAVFEMAELFRSRKK